LDYWLEQGMGGRAESDTEKVVSSSFRVKGLAFDGERRREQMIISVSVLVTFGQVMRFVSDEQSR
jgi:hypothetical protein